MTCPLCGGKSIVADTRTDYDAIYRKRKCLECEHIFYTTEVETDGKDYRTFIQQKDKERRDKIKLRHKQKLLKLYGID